MLHQNVAIVTRDKPYVSTRESLPHIVMHHSAKIIDTTAKENMLRKPWEFTPRCLNVVSRFETPQRKPTTTDNAIAVHAVVKAFRVIIAVMIVMIATATIILCTLA